MFAAGLFLATEIERLARMIDSGIKPGRIAKELREAGCGDIWARDISAALRAAGHQRGCDFDGKSLFRVKAPSIRVNQGPSIV